MAYKGFQGRTESKQMTQQEREQLDDEWLALGRIAWRDAGTDKYWDAVARMAEIERLIAADEVIYVEQQSTDRKS